MRQFLTVHLLCSEAGARNWSYARSTSSVPNTQPYGPVPTCLTRNCGLPVMSGPPGGNPNPSLRRCGVEITGTGPNDLARAFERHVSHCHPPNFRQATDRLVSCECMWLDEHGRICGKTITSPPARPCYGLSQHVAKSVSHFGLWVAYCACHGQAFASRDAKERHESRFL